MWIYVVMDFSATKKGRNEKRHFSIELERDGFTKINSNLYVRYCASHSNALMHKERIKKKLFEKSRISIIFTLNKENEISYHYYGRRRYKNLPQKLDTLPFVEFF